MLDRHDSTAAIREYSIREFVGFSRDQAGSVFEIPQIFGIECGGSKSPNLHRVEELLAPGHEKVPLKIEALRRAKRMNRRREIVTEALQSGTRSGRAVSAFKVQRMWQDLSDCPLIERLEEDRLRRLFESLDLVQVSAGEILAEKGERMEKMFVIAEGMVEAVAVLPNGSETAIRGFGPGQMIGDRALLEHQPWPTVYRAGDSCFVLELDKDGLAQALQGDPDPRQFLDALREQRNDQDVVWSVQKLERT